MAGAIAAPVKYECGSCDERGFKSRADWLFHLVLERHSLKARESMQQLYLQSDGNLFVISGIGEVDITQILDYVAVKIRSFSNFVSFRPEANVCIMVCDEGDFEKFAAVPHVIGGLQPKFRDYKEIPPAEWKSYFNPAPAGGPQVKKEPDSDNQTGGDNGPCTSGGSGWVNNGNGMRTANNGDWDDEQKLPKLEQVDIGDEGLESTNAPTTSMQSTNWADAFAQMEDLVMMPEAERNFRQRAIGEVRNCLRAVYSNCEVVNVGADFLGFNLERDILRLFCDLTGITNPQNVFGDVRPLSDGNLRSAKQEIVRLLTTKSHQYKGTIQDVTRDEGVIDFVYVVGHVRLKCTLLFKPFRLAHTALLCKKLFFTNPQSIFLIKMIVYWSMRKGFSRGLDNCYTIYWLVYFYLIQNQSLAPVIELQQSCNYKLMDQEMNVAFSYDASLLHEMATKNLAHCSRGMTEEDVRSQVQLLLDWFLYMDKTFGEKRGQPGVNLLHKVVCPRLGDLVDKSTFTEGKQVQKSKKKKFKFKKMRLKKKEARNVWEENMMSLGFVDKSVWFKIGKLKVSEALTIQHPFYISENISHALHVLFSKQLFDAIKVTKINLTRLLNGSPASLLDAFTQDAKIEPTMGEDEGDEENDSYPEAKDELPGEDELKSPAADWEYTSNKYELVDMGQVQVQGTSNSKQFWEDVSNESELEDMNQVEGKADSKAFWEDVSNGSEIEDPGQAEGNSDSKGFQEDDFSNESELEEDRGEGKEGEMSSNLFLENLINQSDAANTTITLPSLHPSNYARWTNEMNQVFQSIMLSEAERNARMTVLTQLKSIYRLKYSLCELIPVGADFLGLNVEKVFNIYFDSRGVTNPGNPNRKRTVGEMSEKDIRILQHNVFDGLKKYKRTPAAEYISIKGLSGPIITKKDFTDDNGVTTVNFICTVDGNIELSCCIFIRPFNLAVTALLCKQLVLTNPQSMNLLAMIAYWTKMRQDLAECYLPNPFVIFWLVHFFLVKKGLLPPAVDLQRSCNYEILDKKINVAFSVDPNILNPILTPTVTSDNLISNVELLIEWFVYVDSTLSKPAGSKAPCVRTRCVISPRVGRLILRLKFKVCKERFLYKTKKSGGSKERDRRNRWGQDLVDLGFDVPLWPSLARQRLRDKLLIQHPFYLADNIARNVKAPESNLLFEAIQVTREKLLQLVRVALIQPNVSLTQALRT